MHVERNAPCPCGSGKKYKKCCLAKDEAAQQEAREKARQQALPGNLESPSPQFASPGKPQPPDPLMDAWNARWEEFEEADYEERLALFARTLEEGELMDGEMVSEMTGKLFAQTVEHNERDRFDALIEDLQRRLPEVYAEEAHWLLSYQIKNALVAGRWAKAGALAQALAALAHKQIDVWNAIEEELAYYGQVETLVTAMRSAWPHIRRSRDIVPWGIEEFATRATQYELIYQLEQPGGAHADDPALQERIRFFIGDQLEVETMATTLSWMTGQVTREWKLEDFTVDTGSTHQRAKRPEVDEAQNAAQRNFFHLTLQFARQLHYEMSVPLTRTELATRELQTYLVQRRNKELEYQESMLDTVLRKRDKGRSQRKQFAPVPHPLCPDRERLDRYLAQSLGFLSLNRYGAFALIGLTPLWVRFLVAQGLLEAEAGEEALSELKQVAEDMRPVIRAETEPAQVLRYWETVE